MNLIIYNLQSQHNYYRNTQKIISQETQNKKPRPQNKGNKVYKEPALTKEDPKREGGKTTCGHFRYHKSTSNTQRPPQQHQSIHEDTIQLFQYHHECKNTKKSKKTLHVQLRFGLHKDLRDPTKLRPVAVGEGWQRAFTLTIVRQNNTLFTRFLMPYNFAIGVKGGTNFIHHTLKCEIEKYIDTHENRPPTRCLVSLDITNMFNEVLRQKAMKTISNIGW